MSKIISYYFQTTSGGGVGGVMGFIIWHMRALEGGGPCSGEVSPASATPVRPLSAVVCGGDGGCRRWTGGSCWKSGGT